MTFSSDINKNPPAEYSETYVHQGVHLTSSFHSVGTIPCRQALRSHCKVRRPRTAAGHVRAKPSHGGYLAFWRGAWEGGRLWGQAMPCPRLTCSPSESPGLDDRWADLFLGSLAEPEVQVEVLSQHLAGLLTGPGDMSPSSSCGADLTLQSANVHSSAPRPYNCLMFCLLVNAKVNVYAT